MSGERGRKEGSSNDHFILGYYAVFAVTLLLSFPFLFRSVPFLFFLPLSPESA